MISIVDEDASILKSATNLLKSAGYEVEGFELVNSFLASRALRQTRYLVLDVKMKGRDILALQVRLKAADLRFPIIFLTAHSHRLNSKSVIEVGLEDALLERFDASALLATIQSVTRRDGITRAEDKADTRHKGTGRLRSAVSEDDSARSRLLGEFQSF